MFRVRRDPIWLWLILLIVAIGGLIAYPEERTFFMYCLAAIAVFLLVRFGFEVFKRIIGTPVPDSAVRELLERCAGEGRYEEWAMVKFRPKVSLKEVRRRIGSPSYSEENRLEGFMTKFHFAAPSRPDVGIFYSPNKGFLLGRSAVINALEQRYGRWMLDTWYTLTGALRKHDMTTVISTHLNSS
jgi:hypothetical protein